MTSEDRTAGMRQMWGLADYSGLADRLAPAATELVSRVATPAGRVLDLAAGTGNVAVLAAQCGAAVTAADFSPRMVELGRARTAGMDVDWHEADMQDLPFADAVFDAVLTSFGVLFAPQPQRALTEARRVLAVGGLLAFTSWTAAGFMGRMTETMRRWIPTPDDVPDVLDWGREPVVRTWLDDAGFIEVVVTTTSLPWHFDSPAAMTRFLLAHSPTHEAARRAAGERSDEMFAAVEEVAGPRDEPVRLDAEYLLVTARAS